MDLLQLYSSLHRRFGNQGWWPLASMAGKEGFNDRGYSLDGINVPKNESQRLEVCAGAILAQNTSWKNAEKALNSLLKLNLLDAEKLSAVRSEKLAEAVRSSGYYNQKAIKLKSFAGFLRDNYGCSLEKLFAKSANAARLELLSIRGIGPETADSMLLYAAQKPVFVIDAYTRRFLMRLGLCGENAGYDELQRLFMKSLPSDAALFNRYHALIVAAGKEGKA